MSLIPRAHLGSPGPVGSTSWCADQPWYNPVAWFACFTSDVANVLPYKSVTPGQVLEVAPPPPPVTIAPPTPGQAAQVDPVPDLVADQVRRQREAWLKFYADQSEKNPPDQCEGWWTMFDSDCPNNILTALAIGGALVGGLILITLVNGARR